MRVVDAEILRQPVFGKNLDVVDVELSLEDIQLITKSLIKK